MYSILHALILANLSITSVESNFEVALFSIIFTMWFGTIS